MKTTLENLKKEIKEKQAKIPMLQLKLVSLYVDGKLYVKNLYPEDVDKYVELAFSENPESEIAAKFFNE